MGIGLGEHSTCTVGPADRRNRGPLDQRTVEPEDRQTSGSSDKRADTIYIL